MAKKTNGNGWTPSGIVDAICNVDGREKKQLDVLIVDLTRQLAVAKAVRAALDDEMLPYDDPPAIDAAADEDDQAGLVVTEKATELGGVLLEHGAMTKAEIAAHLDYSVQQVSMTLARNKKHFVEQAGGRYVCSAALAAHIEG